ncbi:MAG: glycosyltransferase family 2 protein [Candidatus Margulisbacteria bacterium]|jgi:hypothetical protein|nr:glycosyltransferase family 2 protein [Candidatus Margulisiibacteriota bacterium]
MPEKYSGKDLLHVIKEEVSKNLFFWLNKKTIKLLLVSTKKWLSSSLYRGTYRLNRKTVKNLIISLTSYPARVPYVHHTIKTLLNQNLKPSRIILWLKPEDYPRGENQLPKKLLKLKKKGLSIEWTRDIKSFTKLIPALQKYPDDIIVTVDDDIFYPEDMLERLYQAHLVFPDIIWTSVAPRISCAKNGNLLSCDHQWKEASDDNRLPSYNNGVFGVSGVLYPPRVLHKDVCREDLFLKLCPTHDDLWFWAMAVLKGTKIASLGYDYYHLGELYVPNTQETGLWHTNTTSRSYAQLKNILKYYPQILPKINTTI